jgi:HlyD family secretion protein
LRTRGTGSNRRGIAWRTSIQQSIKFETVPVERGDVQAKVTATGNLNAAVDVLVSSQISGNIRELYADWNSRVNKGQLVALIDPKIFQSQVDQATATSRSAHASTLTAQAQFAKARADLSAASANVQNAQAIAAKDRQRGQHQRAVGSR